MSSPSEKTLRDLYWDHRLPLRGVAAAVGLSYTATRRLFIAYDIPLRRPGVPAGTHRIDDPAELRRRITELRSKGLSLRAVGKVCGIHHGTVRRVLEMEGVLAPLPRDPPKERPPPCPSLHVWPARSSPAMLTYTTAPTPSASTPDAP